MNLREDIEFDADGITLRGWLYTADGASGPAPTVVIAHGFPAVKEMYLDQFAEAFAGASLGALVCDNRNFGASDGKPRQEIDPWEPVAKPRPRRSRCQGPGARGRIPVRTAPPPTPGRRAWPPELAADADAGAGAGARIASFSTLDPAAAGECSFTRL